MKSAVFIDATCLGRRKTGNETYMRGLLSGLDEIMSDSSVCEAYEVAVITTAEYQGPRQAAFEWIEIPVANFLQRNFLTIPKLLKERRASLYHASYWTRFWAEPCPSILMVHDLSFVSFPRGFKAHEQIVYSQLVKACAKASKHILTVSDFSRSELTRHWGIPDHRITVTPNGIGSEFQPPDAKAGDPPYILAVGNLHPRKNLVRLLEAFVLLKGNKNIPHRLKIVGQPAWLFDDIFESVRRSGIQNQVEFTGYLSQGELVAAYQQADLMVYPSLYEGFGLPPLEAMACGCPVVAAATTSLPEVCGDAAVLIDPTSPRSIADGMAAVLLDESVRGRLRLDGPRRAELFTWKHCAEQTLQAYRKALQA